MPVGLPELCHGGHAVEGHVLHPLAHFLDGAAAHVAVDVGLAPQLAAELEKLVGTEGVVLHHPSPVGVDHPLAALQGPDTVLPVVLVGEAPAGPPEHRHPDLLQSLHHVAAHAVDVGDAAVRLYKNTLVDAPAQVLGEVSVNLRGDAAKGPGFVNMDRRHRRSS